MSGRGRGRAGRPPLVAPNGRAAWRRNDEASRVTGSGRDGRGVRGRGGTSYNGQGGRGRGEASYINHNQSIDTHRFSLTMLKLAAQQLMSWLREQMLTWII